MLIAVGARPVESIPGAFTFRGPADTEAFGSLLSELAENEAKRVVFAVPGAVSWPLPLYELALQTATRLPTLEVVVVTHEEAPLELFGPAASSAIAELLADRRIRVRTSSYPVAFENRSLLLTPDWELEADHVVALPRLKGPRIKGIPSDSQGFILTDGSGVPIGLAVDGANRNDVTLTRETIESIAVERPDPTADAPQGMCLDKGYDYEEVRAILSEFGFTAHIRPRGEEAKAIKRQASFKARRWVVERAHSWMNRFRRLLIRWDKKPENYLAFLHFACGLIAFRAAGLFG